MNRKSFFKGLVSAINLRGGIRRTQIKSDEEALASDWQAVGDDMRSVMTTIDKEIKENNNEKQN